METFVQQFPFVIITNKTPADLLAIHAENAILHWEKFGILAQREPNPAVPEDPTRAEHRYIEELYKVYSEHGGVACSDAKDVPVGLRPHFRMQRRLFYSAEGLQRFSRDKLPGAFEDLLDQVELGVGAVVSAPHPSGMVRLGATLAAANGLEIGANALKQRLRAGDLQGTCHHLANLDRVFWVSDGPAKKEDTDDGEKAADI